MLCSKYNKSKSPLIWTLVDRLSSKRGAKEIQLPSVSYSGFGTSAL